MLQESIRIFTSTSISYASKTRFGNRFATNHPLPTIRHFCSRKRLSFVAGCDSESLSSLSSSEAPVWRESKGRHDEMWWSSTATIWGMLLNNINSPQFSKSKKKSLNIRSYGCLSGMAQQWCDHPLASEGHEHEESGPPNKNRRQCCGFQHIYVLKGWGLSLNASCQSTKKWHPPSNPCLWQAVLKGSKGHSGEHPANKTKKRM